MHRGHGNRPHKAMQQPIGVIYSFLQKVCRVSFVKLLFQKIRVQVWLYEQCNMRIEGIIIGFDEYMNLVLADACERHMKSGAKKPLGRILLKGETITLVQSL
ncbi:Small nuclear ribonucleoprotein polypeptide E [Fasciola hepatica]|uniref:Small nuclear ribonucleoprotein E n=1 Tax=Fasciola hepatica TaxID=6192 RepID=A0A4E0QXV9_FASHE|nr:Small nuclear ribonucleoprotein polypeptide E [Fasciola hepatica]